MNSIEISDPYKVNLKNSFRPQCKDGDVIIELQTCGICGSDLQNIAGNSCKPTKKIGHEVAGIISQIGSKVTNFKIGDRVFVHHHTSCDNCYYCLHSNQTMCDKFIDSLEPCGLSEEFLVPEWNIKHGSILKIPDNISFEEASLIEPLACCIRAWKKISFFDTDSLIVIGIGSIGLMHTMLAKFFGINSIFCVDLNEYRLKFCMDNRIAQSFNLHDKNLYEQIFQKTNQRGVDLVIIATSDMTVFEITLDLVRKGGKILLFGQPSNKAILKVNLDKIYAKEISIIPSYAATNKEIFEAMNLIEDGFNVKKLITKKISFNSAADVLNDVQFGKNSIKSIIVKN